MDEKDSKDIQQIGILRIFHSVAEACDVTNCANIGQSGSHYFWKVRPAAKMDWNAFKSGNALLNEETDLNT